jgi:recombination protein RecT
MTQNALIQQKANSIRTLLEKHKKEIEAALPKHLTAERLLRIVMTEGRKNPALFECSQESFAGAVMQAAQVGLEPGGALGHCYLVPFKNQVQLIIGYRGLLQLANQSERVSKVIARAVYSGDFFEYEFGLKEALVHRQGDPSKRGQLTHVYCIVTLKDGTQMFDVMARDEVDEIKKRSRAGNNGPWVTDYDAMAKKTVVRRLFKYMPASIEIQKAVGLDELADTDEGQSNASIIDVESKTVEGGSLNEKLKKKAAPAALEEGAFNPEGPEAVNS